MPESGSSSGNGLCAPRCPRRMSPSFGGTFGSQQGDVLSALAAGLAADAAQTGRKALKVIRARSPELVRLSEKTGDDLISTSADYIDILLTSLRSDVEVPWSDREQQTREFGRLKAAQGVPLEALIDLLPSTAARPSSSSLSRSKTRRSATRSSRSRNTAWRMWSNASRPVSYADTSNISMRSIGPARTSCMGSPRS